MRLDKFLSNLKYGSRKDVTKFIKDGFVKINGTMIKDASFNIDEEQDIVTIGNDQVFYKKHLTLMMNKPAGVVSASSDALHDTISDLLDEPYFRFDLHTAGRLDIDSEGLLILSNDGELIHKIISPSNQIKKTYYVQLKKALENYQILETGVEILDGKSQPFMTMPALIEKISPVEVRITIMEGKFHQVKRMFEAIDNEVIYLKRIQIGGLKLDDQLSPGEVKELTQAEIDAIFS